MLAAVRSVRTLSPLAHGPSLRPPALGAVRLPHLVRAAGARLVRNIRVDIKTGPNRGLEWSVASQGRGYGSGRFEAERIEALRDLARPGDRVWDIGAHKGYVAMAMARRVGWAGSVVAFEPSDANLWFLRRHLEWNGLADVRVLPVAVSDRDGHDRFGGRGSSMTFRLGGGNDTVRVATLETLKAEERLAQPDLIKIDVEGNEGAVLRGAGGVLTSCALLFISVHGRSCYAECASLLSGRGYRLFESKALARRLADPSLDWGGDHDLVAVGPEHPDPEQVVRRAMW